MRDEQLPTLVRAAVWFSALYPFQEELSQDAVLAASWAAFLALWGAGGGETAPTLPSQRALKFILPCGGLPRQTGRVGASTARVVKSTCRYSAATTAGHGGGRRPPSLCGPGLRSLSPPPPPAAAAAAVPQVVFLGQNRIRRDDAGVRRPVVTSRPKCMSSLRLAAAQLGAAQSRERGAGKAVLLKCTVPAPARLAQPTCVGAPRALLEPADATKRLLGHGKAPPAATPSPHRRRCTRRGKL